MNVDLEKIFVFSSVLVLQEKEPCINDYEVKLRLHVESIDNQQYNIAYQRIQHWFGEILQGAVLISHDDPRMQAWKNVGMRCMDFPTQPLDQVIGMMLMSKLTAMTEQRMSVTQISIASPRDDYVHYICDQQDDLHWFERPGWWQDPGPVYVTHESRGRKLGKVIALGRTPDWKQYNLDWQALYDNAAQVSKISSFDQDENHPTR